MEAPPGPGPALEAGQAGAPSAAELLDSGLRAWQQGDRMAAASAWHQALHTADEQGDRRYLGAAHFNLSVLLADRGDSEGAKQGFASAYRAWSEGVDRSWVAQALAAGGDRLRLAGHLGPARHHLEAALELRREIGEQAEIGALLDRIGEIARAQSRPSEARAFWEEAANLHRGLRNGSALIATLTRLGRLDADLQRFAEAQGWAIAALEVPGGEDDLGPAVDLLAGIAAGAMGRREWARARACAEAALGSPLADRGVRGDLAALLATVAWVEQDPALALRWGREALDLLRTQNDPGLAALLHDLGVLAMEAGEIEDAQRYLDEALQAERGRGDPEGLAGALLGLAEVACRQGNIGMAHARFEEAVGPAGSPGARRRLARVGETLAPALQAAGDLTSARRCLEVAMLVHRDLDDSHAAVVVEAAHDAVDREIERRGESAAPAAGDQASI